MLVIGKALRTGLLSALATIAALAAPGTSWAYCLDNSEITAHSPEFWAAYVVRRADVVIEADLIRPWSPNGPEILRPVRIFKGPRQRTFVLAFPDAFTTIASPTAGIAPGTRRIVALTKEPDGYYAGECEAAALTRVGLTTRVMRRAARGLQ